MSQLPDNDERFMRLALALGRRGLGRTWPNPAVGALVVRDGVIVGRGWTQDGGRPHAETEALLRAGQDAEGATLYVTLEPCSHHGKTPPCADAIVAAQVGRVVAALKDPNPEVAGGGFARLREAGVDVVTGICEAEARRDHAGHIRRIEDKRPHVTLKLAVSADGKTALAGRRPVQISGEAARGRVHLMRAMNDAILIGIGTALSDNPVLTCRLPGMGHCSPIRVVLDGNLRLPVESALVAGARQHPLWVIATADAPLDKEQALQEAGVTVLRIARKNDHLDLRKMLECLAERGLTRILVEAGPVLAKAFLKEGLIDEAVIVRSPTPLGSDAIDAIEGEKLDALTASPYFKVAAEEKLGADLVTILERA
jgi:diaminohydroxyphosphoribosylaminopyrimidine deaminase/5-amino-6-(5-phosphoribosylamino)uracil reductase